MGPAVSHQLCCAEIISFDVIQNITLVLLPCCSWVRLKICKDQWASARREHCRGILMQNLSLEKRTPTLCWHWDCLVAYKLSKAKRVNAAETETEDLKELRATLHMEMCCLHFVKVIGQNHYRHRWVLVSWLLASQQTVEDDNSSLCGVSPQIPVGGMQELAVF